MIGVYHYLDLLKQKILIVFGCLIVSFFFLLLSSQQSARPGGHISEAHEPVSLQLESRVGRSNTNLDELTGCTNNRNDDAVPSVSLQAQFQWVDEYKCSICGIELPLEFVDERQEHFDFHLAERLQEECSSSSSMSHFSEKR